MSYSINGIPLDNPTLGWKVIRGSTPVMGYERSAASIGSIGRDGERPLPSVRTDGSIQLMVRYTDETRSALINLMATPEIVVRDSKRPGWKATGRLLTASPEKFYGHTDWGVELFVISIPGGVWRADTNTTPKTEAGAMGVTHTLYPAITAPVQDAIVRLQGPLENPQVQDSSGSYFVVRGTIPAGEYVRFELATGRAWLTTTDTWTGGTEISGEVDSGGPRHIFEITPTLADPSDPLTTEARLSLTQSSYNTGSGIQVRGANASLF